MSSSKNMSNGCQIARIPAPGKCSHQNLFVRGQAVNRDTPMGTREGEDVAKLGGRSAVNWRCLVLRVQANLHIVSCPLRPDLPYAYRRTLGALNRRTGLNLFSSTVVFVLAQGRSFWWATYTGEGFTGTLQDFTVPYWRFSSDPPQQR